MNDGPKLIPDMAECTRCGLRLEVGDGPGDVAHHDCDWVLGLQQVVNATVTTEDQMRAAVFRQVVMRVHDIPGKELASLASKMITAQAEESADTDGGADEPKRGQGSLLEFTRDD